MTKSLEDYTKENFLGKIIFESLNKDSDKRIDWDDIFGTDNKSEYSYYYNQFTDDNRKKNI